MDLPDEPEEIIEQSTQRYYRDDAVRWVWIFYGLAQATVTMLMAFSVIEGTTTAAVVTAIALVIYVGLNEIFVRPYRTRPSRLPFSGPRVVEPEHEHDEHGEADQ